jgi:hypothetical protein
MADSSNIKNRIARKSTSGYIPNKRVLKYLCSHVCSNLITIARKVQDEQTGKMQYTYNEVLL